MPLPVDQDCNRENLNFCPVFHPSKEEFASFSRYIRDVIEPQCYTNGICKVVPPKGWNRRKYKNLKCTVEHPVSQHVAGKKGVFHIDLIEKKRMSLLEFKTLASSLSSGQPRGYSDVVGVEQAFWKSMRSTMDPPVYGADIQGSLFGDTSKSAWNLDKLNTLLCRINLPGVTRSMLYFGMWRAMFAYHTEDMDLYSINYLHKGKPKFWYCVPPDAASSFERAAQSMFPEKYHSCHEFLRHKTLMISPTQLKAFNVPFHRTLQREGEFVITFPKAYHSGFNLGFNIAEAVNFATLRWIPYGLKARVCKCSPDSVRIDMDQFLTTIFNSDKSLPEDIPEDTWIFSCVCQMYCSSDDASFSVDRPWFECSKCKIWCHLQCIYPERIEQTESQLPDTILCHRCLPKADGIKRIHPNVQRKRKKRSASSRSDTNAPGPKIVHKTAKTFQAKLIRGADITVDGCEARVIAVDGKFARIHYKGYSAERDEWIPRKRTEWGKRIIKVSSQA